MSQEKQLLVDTFFVTPQIVESGENGKFIFKGVFQKCDTKNANGRIYPRSLWERVINDASLRESFSQKRILGMLEHPADGKTDLKKVSHIVCEHQLLENGDVVGTIEALNTPDGKILQELARSGVTLGVSSRATGSLRSTPQGDYVNENDFNFITYDVVYNPSTPKAFLTSISESETEKELEEGMTALDKFNLLESRAAKVLGINTKALDSGIREVADKELSTIIVEATKLVKENPEVEKLADSLIESLQKKKTALVQLTEETVGTIDTGVVRTVPKEPEPPEGEGGWMFDPRLAELESEVERMITALVNDGNSTAGPGVMEAKDEDEDEDEEDEDKEKDENMKKMQEAAQAVIKDSKAPKALRTFAAAYLHENKLRQAEGQGFAILVDKMQAKLDEAIDKGKLVIESQDEKLAAKYQIATDVLKSVVKRYHINEAINFANIRLLESGLIDDEKAKKFVVEALKLNVSKEAVEEAISTYSKAKTELTESTKEVVEDKKVAVEESAKLEEKIAKLDESKEDKGMLQEYRGANLASKLNKKFIGSRSR